MEKFWSIQKAVDWIDARRCSCEQELEYETRKDAQRCSCKQEMTEAEKKAYLRGINDILVDVLIVLKLSTGLVPTEE